MKKILCLVLAAVLLLAAACGQTSSSQLSSSAPPSVAPPSSRSVSQPEIPAQPVVLEAAYLTGLEKEDDYPEGKRITAVMINNIFTARPSYGLSEAKILVESKVEGGITRVMAMYEDYQNLPRIGSLRSARDQFFQVLLPTYGFFVHVGPDEQQPVNQMLEEYQYEEYDLQPGDGDLVWMQEDRHGETYWWYNTDGAHINGTIQQKGTDDYRSYGAPLFNFGSYKNAPRVPTDGRVDALCVKHSPSYLTLMEYDEKSQKYEMSMFNGGNGQVEPTVDGNNNERLRFDNVLVLFAPMSLWESTPLVRVELGVGGGAFYFSQGSYEHIIWRKGPANHKIALYDKDGSEQEVVINPGTTYMAIVDDAEAGAFFSQILEGTALQVAADGELYTGMAEEQD